MTPVILMILSMTVTLALAFTVWRMKLQERRRSDARVAALAGIIDEPEESGTELFATTVTTTQRNPLVKAAIGFGVVTVAISAVVLTTQAIALGARRAAPHETTSQVAGDDSPLELITLNHRWDRDTFVVTGVVRNPGRTQASGVLANVVALNEAGLQIAANSSQLNTPVLAGGTTSEFTVLLPHMTSVGRYRVSFYGTDGVLKHVDHRTTSAATTTVAPGRANAVDRVRNDAPPSQTVRRAAGY